MKRLHFLFIFFFISTHAAEAAHIVGGQLNYEYRGGDEYLITLKLFRDQNCTNCADFDANAIIGIFDGAASHDLLQSVTLPRVNLTDSIPFDLNNPCLLLPDDIRYGEAIYQATVNLAPRMWGYDLLYQRCCRTSDIINLIAPSTYGITLLSSIPGTVDLTEDNSSPVFDKLPPVAMCIGDQLEFDHSAIDPDGDSLAYEFYTPLSGGGQDATPTGGCNTPVPNPPCFLTIRPVRWAVGYGPNNQIAGNPGLVIDPETGILYGSPSLSGQFQLGIRVKEYRGGQFIGATSQEFIVTVTACQSNASTAIADQQFFCNGLTSVFLNNSTNADTSTIWFWDFGDPNNPNDTSSAFSPTYTYSDTGTYTVTLIANAGFACADTSYSTFTIGRALVPIYDPPTPQCFNGNSYDFESLGFFEGNGTFAWDFGSGANPSSSSLQDPMNITFLDSGYHVVTLTIDENGCNETYVDSIYVQPSPTAAFDISEVNGCVPFGVDFALNGQPTDLDLQWDFGDGNGSSDVDPSHTYAQAGSYNASLQVTNSFGCQDAFTFSSPIVVSESPQAGFGIDPLEILLTNPQAFVTDSSLGATMCEYIFNGNVVGTDCDFIFQPNTSGTFELVQIVTNEFGCSDTSFKLITIVDDRDFSVDIPNTITPNGDQQNDTWQITKIDLHPNNRVIIFNRSGKQIFEASPYENATGWDGNWEGKPAPAGAYMYFIELGDDNNTVLTGALNVIR